MPGNGAVLSSVLRCLLPAAVLLAIAAMLPQAVASQLLDDEARAWVREQGVVRVAPDPDFAPIDYFDARGRHSGLSAELLALLAKRSGLRFQAQRTADFGAARAALEAGEVELLSSVFRSEARAGAMLFSTPYLRLPAALIGRRDGAAVSGLEELRGRRIAIVRGHVWQELLSERGFTGELLPAPNIEAALAMVAAGEADAYVGDLLSADLALRRSKLDGQLMVLGETGLEAGLAFAVRQDLPELKRVLDLALASVSVAEESALRARWERADGQSTSSEAPAIPASLSAELKSARAAIAGDSNESAELRDLVEQGLRLDGEADLLLTQQAKLERDLGEARSEIERNRMLLAPGSAEELLRWRGSLPQRASLNDLEQLLATERAARGSLQEAIARASQQLLDRQQRPASLRSEISETMARLEAVQLADDDGRLRTRVERLRATAERRMLLARQSLLLLEQAQLDTLAQAAELRLRERQRQFSLRGERMAVLEQLIAERSDRELIEELEQLREMARRHASASPAIRELGEENLATGELLLRQTRRLGQLREQAQRLERQAGLVSASLENAEARVAIGGITESVGILLMAERRKLPNAAALRAQRNALQAETAEAQLAQLALAEEREVLGDLRAAVAARLGSDVDGDAESTPELRAVLTDLLLLRSQLLPRLQRQQQRVLEVLGEAERAIDRLLADSRALAALMERHLLWIPSHRPVGAGWLTRLGEDWMDLIKPSRWTLSWQRLAERLPGKPLWLLGLALPMLLWLSRPRIDSGLQALADRVRRVREDRFRWTTAALALTALRAAPAALLLLVCGHMLQSVGDGGRFTHSLGRALQTLAPYVYLSTLLIASCRQQGLAHVHLRWPRARRAALLALRPWLYGLMLPLLFMVALSAARDLDAVNATLLRAGLSVAALGLAIIAWWLLHPQRLLTVRGVSEDARPRLRRSLRLLLPGGLLALAILPLAGYVFTGGILLKVVLDTAWVLFAVALGHGLVLRWLVLGERRLFQVQQQAVAPAGTELADAAAELPVVSQESIDLKLAGSQSRTLLRAATAVLLGSGLLWSLSDVAPAFALLDTFELWHTSETVDGSLQMRPVTLGGLIMALVALIFGVIAARNVPGLLELLLLQRFTEDASLRYAVVTVVRYAITFLVLVAVFGLLGVRWGHLQWLAAAFSVGLGFGLQEIFGNFVAGLILLFERPFRVGDVVTIGNYTGTVRRIRTRATTIVDFDNKDIVIPNKAFITERFVNWTLSDTTTRIILKVGVGYGSDPVQVRDTLLEIARAHPSVLEDPAPSALFLELGSSTLNFELRCFVREIRDRVRTSHDLHTAIIRRFRECAIEIAFPQLDVNLRGGSAPAVAAGAAGSG